MQDDGDIFQIPRLPFINGPVVIVSSQNQARTVLILVESPSLTVDSGFHVVAKMQSFASRVQKC